MRTSTSRVVLAATLGMLVAAWPPFLVSVLALQLRDIGLSLVNLGTGVALFFATAAVLSPLGGELVQWWGAPTTLRVVASMTATVCAGLALAAYPSHVFLLLVVAGAANALIQPAAGALIRAGVAKTGHGMSLGIVQAAVPMTIVASAATVPLVAYVSTWRVAFVIAACVAVVAVLLVPRRVPVQPSSLQPRRQIARPSHAVIPFLFTALLASTAASALSTYAATSGHELGLDPATVAAWVAASGLACAVVRVLAGRAAGGGASPSARRGLAVMATLFLLGGIGYAILAIGDPSLFGPGLAIAYGFGWAWTGVLHFVIGAATVDATRSTGWTQVGVFGGGAVGPLVFAFLADGTGELRTGWIACTAYLAVALTITATLLKRRRNRRQIR